MKTTKRILSLFLCMVMILGMIPMIASAEEGTWELVTDVSTLAVGDQVIIAAAKENYALGTTQNSNNRASVSITKSADGNTIETPSSSVQILTLQAGKTDGTFAFYTGKGYLYAASSTKNYLRTETTLSANSSWNISIASGVATIKAQGSNTRNWLRFNTSNSPKIFACYGSGQTDVCLYKFVAGAVDPDACQHANKVYDITSTTHQQICADCDDYKGTVTLHNADGENDTCTVCGTAIANMDELRFAYIDAVYALEAGASLDSKIDLTGVITEVTDAWSTQYNNITVVIEVAGKEDKPITCYRLKSGAADASNLVVGDIITVTGTLMNYNGTKEFTSGCVLDAVTTHKHTYGEEWYLTADDLHYQKCTLCGVETEAAAHVDADGDKTCDVCQNSCGCAHDFSIVKHDNNVHTEICSLCGEEKKPEQYETAFVVSLDKDESGHWYVCTCNQLEAKVEAHDGDLCSVCSYFKAPELNEFFNKVDMSAGIAEGYYVIGGLGNQAAADGATYGFMNGTQDGTKNRLMAEYLQVNCISVTTADANLVWKFTAVDGGFTIMNVDTQAFLYYKNTSNEIYWSTDAALAGTWVVTETAEDSGIWTLKDVDSGRYLSITRVGTTGAEYLAFATYDPAKTSNLCSIDLYLNAAEAQDHEYDYDCDAECNICGATREASHQYAYPCDAHCMICYELTNPDAAHTIAAVEAKAATCTENGNIAYWYCEHCGAVWADEALTQITNRMSVVIPAPGHTYDDNCDFDCNVCEEFREAPHTLGDAIPAKVPANCLEEGYDEHWICEDCGGYFMSNGMGGYYETNPAWINYTGDHVRPEGAAGCAVVACELCGEDSYGTDPCDRGDAPACQDATCVKCGGVVYGEGHSYGYDEDGNSLIPLCQAGDCIYCGEHLDYIYECENGSYAPCSVDGECVYGCGKQFPATGVHAVDDPCVGGLCWMCWETIEGAHNYVDGKCTACGAIDAILDESLTFAKMAIGLESYIGAQFMIDPLAIYYGKYESAYIVVTYMGEEYTYTDSLLSQAYYYVFEHRLAPKYMAETMEITAYAVKNGVTYCGNTVEWSVKQGILDILDRDYDSIETDATKRKQCVLLVDMLYYGAEAQKTFKTDGNGLTTDGLDEKYVALRTVADPVINEQNTAVKMKKNQLYMYALGVEDKVDLQFVFWLSSTNYSEYTIKVTYGGTVYEYTEEAFTEVGTGVIAVSFAELGADAMRKTVTVELWQNGARVSDVYTASIAGTSVNLDAAYADLAVAMMKYGDSAAAYFAK